MESWSTASSELIEERGPVMGVAGRQHWAARCLALPLRLMGKGNVVVTIDIINIIRIYLLCSGGRGALSYSGYIR